MRFLLLTLLPALALAAPAETKYFESIYDTGAGTLELYKDKDPFQSGHRLCAKRTEKHTVLDCSWKYSSKDGSLLLSIQNYKETLTPAPDESVLKSNGYSRFLRLKGKPKLLSRNDLFDKVYADAENELVLLAGNDHDDPGFKVCVFRHLDGGAPITDCSWAYVPKQAWFEVWLNGNRDVYTLESRGHILRDGDTVLRLQTKTNR